MHATLDPVYCNAFVDFNVTGKSDRKSSKLIATIWKQSRVIPTGTFEKNAIEFTDLSGKLINIWVQADDAVTKSDPGPPPNLCIEGSPLVFKDMNYGNSKLVTLDLFHLSITPFDGKLRLTTFACNY